MGLQGLNYKDILKNTLRAAIKMTPITAAPPGREETTTFPLFAPHANAGSTSQVQLHSTHQLCCTWRVPSARWINKNARIWILLFAL